MSNLIVERIGYSCGARVTGVDVSKPLSDAVMAQIYEYFTFDEEEYL